MTKLENCLLLELQQDRIMDRVIEKSLGITSIRQVFPSGHIYLIAYGRNGLKLHEEWVN